MRQPRTRQPKAKFTTTCLTCGQPIQRRIVDNKLLKSCGCPNKR